MRKFLLFAVIFITLIFAKDVKVGFVDSDRIFNEYQATAAAKIEFDEFVKTYRDSAAVLKQNIEQLKADFEGQKLVLSEEARLRKLDEIESLTQSYNQFLQSVFGNAGRIDQKNDELMTPLLKKINSSVAKVAEQEGFSIVLDLSDGVFYGSSDLELTDLVIDELNLEYGPQTLPTGETRKVIAIFPFREENTEAIDAGLGQRCQNELYKISNAFSKFKFVGKTDINMEIIRRGYGRNIDDEQAFNIAHTLLCDYIIIGTVKKFATRIDYAIFLKELETTETIATKTNSLTEETRLSEYLNNDLRSLIEKIQ